MNYFLSILLFCVTAGLSQAQAQEFDRLYSKSIQPILSQPLQWVTALPSAAPSLPEAFVTNPGVWAFAPYTTKTVLPTAADRNVWVKFTLAATATPQSWVIRIPRVSVQKVSLYAADTTGSRPVQSAGASIAPAAWNRSTRTPSFEVMTSSQETSYFLRFENRTPLTERPELMSQGDFAEGASRVGTLIGLMFGMFGLLMLACLAANVLARNTVFLSLGAFVAALLLQYLVVMGFGGWRIWPGSVHLNQAMSWVAPLLAMAAGCWFFAQASYAKDSNKSVYRLLNAVALASLGLACFMLVSPDQLQRSFLNNWTVLVLVVIVASLLWLSLRGMRWNLWLLAGLVPIAAAATTRLAYNYGWLSHVEFAQTGSVFLTALGLIWVFVALAWRSRDALLSTELAHALANNDPITGLVQQRVAKARLEQMLLRAARLKLGCGVIMLRWANYVKVKTTQSPEQRDALLKQLAQVLGRVVRDVDTAAVLADGYFMLLIEGPVSRAALSSLATQVMTSSIRSADKFDMPNVYNLHIAIWQADLVPTTSQEVMEALNTRISQMSEGTKRPVQFVDSMNSDPGPEQDAQFANRRDELVAKINAIEASPNLHTPLVRYPARK